MRYKKDSILEVASFVQNLNSEERESLLSHLGKDGSKNHLRIVQELDQITTGENFEAQHDLLSYTDASRSYSRFKKKLEEFRLTEESISFLNKRDVHAQQQLHLAKQFLSAQIEFEQGLTQNTLEHLGILYKKAEKLEILNLQLEIAEKVKRINQSLGNNKEYLKWKVLIFEIRHKMEVFKRIAHTFNELTTSILCCEHHSKTIDRDYLFAFQMAFKRTGLIKVRWMKGYLRAIMFRKEGDHKNSQRIAWRLLSIYKENQLILSRHYYLILMQFILENMYYLKKVHVVRKGGKRMHALEKYPLFQTFPFISMNLYELFRQNDSKGIYLEIDRIHHDHTIHNYMHIRQHLCLAVAHAKFLDSSYDECLQLINRDMLLTGVKCYRQNADLRCLELMCLIQLKKYEAAFDKIESFRKFLSRIKDGDVALYLSLLDLFRSMLKQNSKATILNHVATLKEIEKPIYSYQPYGFFYWVKSKLA